jgi:hypothetical protein
VNFANVWKRSTLQNLNPQLLVVWKKGGNYMFRSIIFMCPGAFERKGVVLVWRLSCILKQPSVLVSSVGSNVCSIAIKSNIAVFEISMD